MEPISRSDMAALCHLSLSEFSRVFRREHEVTFEHFLLEFRIAKARDLLIESRLTITQVAHAVGFNDSSYFARAFRRCTGIKASDWRRGAIVNPPAGAR
jgi:AraC-like DNA-binding protein